MLGGEGHVKRNMFSFLVLRITVEAIIHTKYVDAFMFDEVHSPST